MSDLYGQDKLWSETLNHALALPRPIFVDPYQSQREPDHHSPGERVVYRWPTFGTLTSRFGDSRPGGRRHRGIDIANAVGTPIFAAAGGTVVFSGWSSGYGNLIILEHANGDRTYYAHNSANRVRVGDVVTSGQWIGDMGSTGRSTGPHLHFEIRKRHNGQFLAIDPLLELGNSFTARK